MNYREMTGPYEGVEWRGWLAGMIDGEGSIAIGRATGRVGYLRGIQMRPYVQIANTDRRLIDVSKALMEYVSGHRAFISTVRRQNPNHRLGWAVSSRSNSAVLALLTSVRPCLIGKAEQADVVMAYCRRHLITGPGHRRSDETFDLDELDYARCRVLNRRGNHGGPDIEEMERMVAAASTKSTEG